MCIRAISMFGTAGLMMFLLATPAVTGEMPTEPVGGKPSADSRPSVENLADQVTYQRAFEAVVWSMPAVIKYGMGRASLGIGAGNNVLMA